jgi:hypothetical protein
VDKKETKKQDTSLFSKISALGVVKFYTLGLAAIMLVMSFLSGYLGVIVYKHYNPSPKFYTLDFTKVLVAQEKTLSNNPDPAAVKKKIDGFVKNVKAEVKTYNKKAIIIVSQAEIKGSKFTKNITKQVEAKVIVK